MTSCKAIAEIKELQENKWQAELVRALGRLNVSPYVTINDIRETGADEAHFWRNEQGAVGVHIKRPSDESTELTVNTRMYFHYDQDGLIDRVHLMRFDHQGSAENGTITAMNRARLTRLGGVGLQILSEELEVLEERLPEIPNYSVNLAQAA